MVSLCALHKFHQVLSGSLTRAAVRRARALGRYEIFLGGHHYRSSNTAQQKHDVYKELEGVYEDLDETPR